MEKEVILEAIKTNPELQQEIVKTFAELDAGKEYLSNFKEVIKGEVLPIVREEENAKARKEIYSSLEKDYFKATGQNVPTDVKTYDHFAKEFEELSKLRKGGAPNGVDVSEFEAKINKLVKEKEDAENQWKEKYTTKEQEIVNFKKDNIIQASLSGFKFKEDIPSELIETYVSTIKNELKSSLTFNDKGEAILVNSDGSIMRDELHKEVTISDYLKSKLNSITDVKANGGFTAPTNTKGSYIEKNEKGDVKVVLASGLQFAYREELISQIESVLLESGITVRDKNFHIAKASALAAYGGLKLPIKNN